jgi:hypothetical protein
MSSAPPIPSSYTEEEFLVLEDMSAVKHEFLNGVCTPWREGRRRMRRLLETSLLCFGID